MHQPAKESPEVELLNRLDQYRAFAFAQFVMAKMTKHSEALQDMKALSLVE